MWMLCGESGFAAGVDVAGLGCGDAFALAFQDQGTLELGEGLMADGSRFAIGESALSWTARWCQIEPI
jgi:hypothetical protein